jgi:hypothetical protein
MEGIGLSSRICNTSYLKRTRMKANLVNLPRSVIFIRGRSRFGTSLAALKPSIEDTRMTRGDEILGWISRALLFLLAFAIFQEGEGRFVRSVNAVHPRITRLVADSSWLRWERPRILPRVLWTILSNLRPWIGS